MNIDVTDGHEVSRHSDTTHQILEQIATQEHVSQRALASSLGIALGLTNSLVRGLIQRGWVRATRVQRHRVRYLLTPAGIAEKARLSRAAFHNAVDRYRVARERVQEALQRVSESWPADPDTGPPASPKPVIFYGTSEVAEIGFICLQHTDLQLVAVIDDSARERFFGVPVIQLQDAACLLKTADPATRLLVMSLARTDKVEGRVADLGCPAERVIWI